MEQTASILIVDDYEGVRDNLSLIFGKMGYRTEMAGTAREAMEKARGRFFNAALVDITLPDGTGVDVLASLKEMHPDMAVIMITGNATTESVVRALNEGASAYVAKPFDVDAVAATVREALGRQRLVVENRRLYEEAKRELAERRKAEESLREREQEFRHILDASYDVVYRLNLNTGTYDYISPSALRVFGHAPEEIRAAGFEAIDSLVHPDDRERVKQDNDRLAQRALGLAKEASAVTTDYRLNHDEAEYRWVSDARSVVFDEGGTPVAVVGIVRDITERKKAEETLRRSEEVSRIASQLATDLVYERDIQTGIATYYGDIDSKMGYGQGEYPRTVEGTLEHIHQEDLPRFYELNVDDFNAGRPMTVEYRRRKKDGTYAYWVDRFALIRDEATGNPVRLVGVATDITERKRVQEALERSEARYRSLVETSAAGIAAVNLKGEVTYANETMCDILGRSGEELAGKPFARFLHPDDVQNVVRVFTNAVTGARTQPLMEFRLLHKDGHAVWCYTSPTALQHKGEEVEFAAIIHDITQRKMVEERLRESEQRFRLASQIANDLVYERDARTGVATFYGDIDTRMGYGPGEFPRTAEGWAAHLDPEDSPALAEQIAAQTERGEPFSVEYRMTRKDGAHTYWLDRFITIWDQERGAPLRILGVATDITERKQAEERLRTSEHNYRVLFESTMDGLVVIDAATMRGVLANQSAARMYGLDSSSQVEGADPLDYVHPDDRERLIAAVREGVLEKDLREVREFRTVSRDGREIWVSGVGARVEYQGRPAALFSFIDITERRRMEDALRQNEQELRLMFESVTEGITVTDLRGIVTDVNPTAIRMHRFRNKNEVVGTSVFELIVPRDRTKARTNMRKTLEQGSIADVEYAMVRADGSEFPAEWGASVLNDASGRTVGFIAVTKDITERREAEERLRDYRQQLRSLASRLSLVEERERRRLAADLHDRIGQTLAVINLKLGALREPASTEDLDRQLGEIRAHVEQVIGDTRSLTFELSPPVLYELGLEAALEWLVEQFQKRHRIPCELKDDGRAKPLGDDVRAMLFRAASELLLNVAKHAHAHAVGVSVRRLAHEVRVTVEDDGVGFDPSGAGDRSRGFGLFNIRERLEQIGGRVDIKSRPGRGTRVTMVAPLKRKARAKRRN